MQVVNKNGQESSKSTARSWSDERCHGYEGLIIRASYAVVASVSGGLRDNTAASKVVLEKFRFWVGSETTRVVRVVWTWACRRVNGEGTVRPGLRVGRIRFRSVHIGQYATRR